MDSDSRVLIAGANGMVGSAIVRNLESKGYAGIIKGTRQVVDFTDQEATDTFFRLKKPEYVFVAAAKVGGIMANNNYRADFLTENLHIQTNIIESANRWNVTKLLFLGSSCIYPKFATQPITEDQLMTGALEPTNDAYAIAKIAGIMMCQAYRQQHGFNAISLMPTNLYGPNDNFDLETSHVLPALIRKFHEAKESNAPYVECWGDGSARREFLHVDDLAEACFRCMISYNDSEIINVGTGEDLTIKELTTLISIIIGYDGNIKWDDSKPNGTPRKVLNVDKIKSLGWSPKIGIRQGIYETYEWYLNSLNSNS
jgi:GDP-L-fucose synthase